MDDMQLNLNNKPPFQVFFYPIQQPLIFLPRNELISHPLGENTHQVPANPPNISGPTTTITSVFPAQLTSIFALALILSHFYKCFLTWGIIDLFLLLLCSFTIETEVRPLHEKKTN